MNVKRNRMRARVTNTLQVINSITQLKIGLCLLAVIILLALFAPFLAVYDPFALNDDLLAPPGSQYLLGTDGLGRDVFSELLYGARTSIFIGVGKFKILTKHIIPNGIFPIIANTTMNISGAILTEAGLSFLGLGDPNLVSWGQMVFHGKSYLVNGWWISTFSGFAIVVTVLAFYLIGDGLNHVLSPKLRDIK